MSAWESYGKEFEREIRNVQKTESDARGGRNYSDDEDEECDELMELEDEVKEEVQA